MGKTGVGGVNGNICNNVNNKVFKKRKSYCFNNDSEHWVFPIIPSTVTWTLFVLILLILTTTQVSLAPFLQRKLWHRKITV